MKILWLVSWYPNRIEPFAGDFIQRHARAVSLYHEIQVIHVVRDAKGAVTKDVLIEEHHENKLHELIIYYYSSHTLFSFADKLFSHLKYNRVFRKAIIEHISKNGKPDGLHVHVGMKAGLLAQWICQVQKVPYVVTEHWTGFLPEASRRFADMPLYLQRAWKRLLNKANSISAVSAYLARNLRSLYKIEPAVIPNVVNTAIFYPAKNKENIVPRFIHISGLDYQKNPEAIIDACDIVRRKGHGFRLDIFGPSQPGLELMAKKLGLNECISFHHEIPQAELADHMRQSDALILYSRYETFGCVVIEANACGVPVIASNIPAMHELLQEGKNGFLVKSNDPVALAEKITWFISTRPQIDNDAIAKECAAKYNYRTVGQQFSEWYKTVFRA